MTSGTSGDARRTVATRSSTSSVSSACMPAIPTSPGRGLQVVLDRTPEAQIGERDACPRASSAAAMYSMPSGSIRKNGPSPKRSLRGRAAAATHAWIDTRFYASRVRTRSEYRTTGRTDIPRSSARSMMPGRSDMGSKTSAESICHILRIQEVDEVQVERPALATPTRTIGEAGVEAGEVGQPRGVDARDVAQIRLKDRMAHGVTCGTRSSRLPSPSTSPASGTSVRRTPTTGVRGNPVAQRPVADRSRRGPILKVGGGAERVAAIVVERMGHAVRGPVGSTEAVGRPSGERRGRGPPACAT